MQKSLKLFIYLLSYNNLVKPKCHTKSIEYFEDIKLTTMNQYERKNQERKNYNLKLNLSTSKSLRHSI